MENSHQEKNQSEELKLSPLGVDEINSVIKSFKNSTFNQEDLYKKDVNNFVKKSLFDLAKESEKNSLKENNIDKDNNREEDTFEKNVNVNEEILEKPDQNDGIDNTRSLNDLDNNNENDDKPLDQVDASADENIKLVEEQEKFNVEQKVSEKTSEEIIEQNISDLNHETPDTKLVESDKMEYEEKTIEALDSVREAVTKSLEENNNIENEEIKNKSDDTKIVSNNIISEINLINTLFKNIREISNDEIENIVKSKVIELAEDVIGFQIEKFPDKFLKKIKNSINDLKSINKEIKIYLNDVDFEILNKFTEKNEIEINFKFVSDPTLGRGDFTIDMGGVIQAIKYKKVIE